MRCSVILADDHPIVLRGLIDLLADVTDFEIIDSTTNGPRALSLVRSLKPDLAVLDVSMPDVGGLDILRSLYEYDLAVRVIFLTATMTGRQVADAVTMGVWGLLLKENAPDKLIDCMRQVASGSKWLPDGLMAKAQAPPVPRDLLSSLTPREQEVATLVCSGISNRMIANQLGTSVGTIGIHLHNVYQKLHISSRMALAAACSDYFASRHREP